MLATTLGLCLVLLGAREADGEDAPSAPYKGFEADRVLIRKTVRIKPSLNASSPEAIQASLRIFERVPFLFKTREEVLKLLGDPSTISGYGKRAGPDPDSPLVYVFDSGYGGSQYTIGFLGGKVNRVQVDPMN
jgi:hypothetical protein